MGRSAAAGILVLGLRACPAHRRWRVLPERRIPALQDPNRHRTSEVGGFEAPTRADRGSSQHAGDTQLEILREQTGHRMVSEVPSGATDNELTIARSRLATAMGYFVYRADDGRILTDNEAFDELTPEMEEGLALDVEREGLSPEGQVIDGGDVESFIFESGIYEVLEVAALVVTQYTDGRTRWTNDQLREQVFPVSGHSNLSFEDWLAVQVDAGTLTAVDVLQFIGYENEDAEEETVITERLIID